VEVHLVSGFLGSGKTTAIIGTARQLVEQGVKVAVITNDQGSDLVDTGLFQSAGITSGEVAGGCFCCMYNDLTSEIKRIRETVDPQIVFAEAVGSCTDLVATVVRPLELGLSNGIRVGSYSVFVDVNLLGYWLSGMNLPFTDDIRYIFEQQINESTILIVNKIDLLSEHSRERVRERLQAIFPGKKIMLQSSLDASDLNAWWSQIHSAGKSIGESIDIDYDRYASGESQLAWYNSRITLSGEDSARREYLFRFMREFQKTIQENSIPVGHAKLLASDEHTTVKYSMVHDQKWSESPYDADRLRPDAFVLNARLECTASLAVSLIHDSLNSALTEGGDIEIEICDEQAFHPAYPEPLHRMA